MEKALGKNWILYLGAAVVAYVVLKRGESGFPKSLGYLTGAAANLLNVRRQESASFDPGALQMELAEQTARASVVQEAVTKNPSLGTFLGLSPQTVDYIRLPESKYQSIYGFNPPESVTGGSTV